MKFMQRAAASASSNASADSEVPSSKKRKMDHSPAQGRINPNIDQALIKAALDDQEATRLAALQKHSTADTHWILNTTLDGSQNKKRAKAPMNVVYVGYGDIDSSNESGDNEEDPATGRTSTRKPSKKEEKISNDSGSESSDDGNSSSEEAGETPSRKRKVASRDTSRSRSRPRTSEESAKAKDFRDKRIKKDVRLNKLTSISSAGSSQFGSQGSAASKSIKCYKCQKMGHKAVDCAKS